MNITSKKGKSDLRQDLKRGAKYDFKSCLCISMKMFSIGGNVELQYKGMQGYGFDGITKST